MSEEKKDYQDPRMNMDSVRFFSLVSMFSASAYQNMGKIADPVSGEVSRNLEAAQGFIDILVMLRNKTTGNLEEQEYKLLDTTISDLQLNYVQEKARPEPEQGSSSDDVEAKEQEDNPAPENDPSLKAEDKESGA